MGDWAEFIAALFTLRLQPPFAILFLRFALCLGDSRIPGLDRNALLSGFDRSIEIYIR